MGNFMYMSILIWAILSVQAQSEELVLEPQLISEDSQVRFKIPYTFGTHHGHISKLTGKILLDKTSRRLVHADFSLPLLEMHTGDATRDCHMREALGLNYHFSDFPEKHVCDERDSLPVSGANSLAYPEITVRILQVLRQDGQEMVFNDPDSHVVKVKGLWTIHGVSQEENMVLNTQAIDLSNNTYSLAGEHTFDLRDYGVIVKRFLLIVAVDHKISVNFNLKFKNNPF